MNQQAMSSVVSPRIAPVVGSYTSTPLTSTTIDSPSPTEAGPSFLPPFVRGARGSFQLPLALLRPNPVNDQIGFAENHEQVPRSGLFEQVVPHRQIGIHPAHLNGELAVTLGFFVDVRIE